MLAAQNEITIPGSLKERLQRARHRTDELFALVRESALYDRPIPERHRIIFYIGHVEAFDWNLLAERVFGLKSFDPSFDRLFAFGIDPIGGGLPDDQPSDWPSADQVWKYAAKVRSVLDEHLESGHTSTSSPDFPPNLLFNVAIEHRLMHAETLSYMLHQLPGTAKLAPPQAQSLIAPIAEAEMADIPAGLATLGQKRTDGKFGWDNEYESTTIEVPAFSIDRFKVTNGQFLEFVRAGGYDSRFLWSDEDWNWKCKNNISQPVFWKRDRDGWLYRGMFEEVPLPLETPVYVSHAEAQAYARWLDKHLPTEAQWHRAAYGTHANSERAYPWGDEEPTSAHGNFDFARWDPVPVTAFPNSRSEFGVAGMLDNGWEWTGTPFAAFAGFERFPFYPGYSADFFDGKHFVMKGGSARTAACMLRRSFRNWFQPHYQYVYTGFRCVRG